MFSKREQKYHDIALDHIQLDQKLSRSVLYRKQCSLESSERYISLKF